MTNRSRLRAGAKIAALILLSGCATWDGFIKDAQSHVAKRSPLCWRPDVTPDDLGFAFEPARLTHQEMEVLRFACQLYDEGEYYRSITELKRFASHFPSSDFSPKALFLVGEIYFQNMQWEEALRSYEIALRKYPGSAIEEALLYKKALCAIMSGKEKDILDDAEKIRLAGDSSFWNDSSRYLTFLSLLFSKKWEQAKQAHMQFQQELSSPAYQPVACDELFALAGRIPRRDPTIAGILSGILPGAGQLYCGNYADAALSMLFVGLFGLACHESLESDIESGAVIFGTVGLSFYFGNIRNAVEGAKNFNSLVEEEYLRLVKRATFQPAAFWFIKPTKEPDFDVDFLIQLYN